VRQTQAVIRRPGRQRVHCRRRVTDDSLCLSPCAGWRACVTERSSHNIRSLICRQDSTLARGNKVSFEDREGNLWVGGNNTGLHRFKKAQIIAYTAENGLADDALYRLRRWPRRLWLGGKNLITIRAGEFTLSAQGTGRLWSLNQDPDGGIWPDWANSPISKMWRDVSPVPRGNCGDGALPRSGRKLWVGLPNNSIAMRAGWHVSKTAPEQLQHERRAGSQWVRFITEDRTGALWIGTTGG